MASASAFITYSHKDAEFVAELRDRLKAADIDAVGDWLLVGGEKYEERLRRLILSADAFVFVVTPESIASEPCSDELSIAVAEKKAILPAIRVRPAPSAAIDSALRSVHWTFLDEPGSNDDGYGELARAIRTDLDLMTIHARLLAAADDWSKIPPGRGLLPRGELREAEGWLARVAARPLKLPQPTDRELAFIVASQQRRRRNGWIAGAVAVGIIAVLVTLSVIAVINASRASTSAEREREAAQRERDTAQKERETARAERGARATLLAQFPNQDREALNLAILGAGPYWVEHRPMPEPVVSGLASAIASTRASIPTAGHADDVVSIAMSADGTVVASGGADGRVRLWDAATGALIRETRQDGTLHVLGFLADAQRIVVQARPSGRITTWNPKDDGQIAWSQPETGDVRVGPDGRSAVSVHEAGDVLRPEAFSSRVTIWDPDTGRPRATIDGGTLTRSDAVFSKDGRLVVVGDVSGRVAIRSTATGGIVREWQAHTKVISRAVLAPSGDIVGTVSHDGSLRTWNAADGTRLAEIQTSSVFLAPVFTPNGQYFLWEDTDAILVIDSRTGQTFRRLTGPAAARGPAIFSADGSRVFASSYQKETRTAWDVQSGREIRTEPEQPALLRDLIVARGAPRGVLVRADGSARVLALDDNTVVADVPAQGDAILSAACSRDCARIATGHVSGSVRIWPGVVSPAFGLLSGHSDTVYGAAFAPTGNEMVTAAFDRTVRFWRTATGETTRTVRHDAQAWWVGYAANGARVVSVSQDDTIRVWDVANGTQITRIVHGFAAKSRPMLSADGRQILTSVDDSTICLWDADNGRELLRQRMPGVTLDWRFVGNQPRVLVAMQENRVALLDPHTKAPLATFVGHSQEPIIGAIAEDGHRVATVARDDTVRTWDAASGRPLAVVPYASGSFFWRPALSRDGARLATLWRDGSVRLFDAATGALTLSFRRLERADRAAEFSPDGTRLATWGSGAQVAIYPIAEATIREVAHTLVRHQPGYAPLAAFFTP